VIPLVAGVMMDTMGFELMNMVMCVVPVGLLILYLFNYVIVNNI